MTDLGSSGLSEQQHGILRLFWTIQQTKELPRQGIILAGFKQHEVDTVAAHSWTVSVLAYLLARDLKNRHGFLDPAVVLEMALFHDVGEALTGDVARYVKWKAKEAWDVVETESVAVLDEVVNPNGSEHRRWLSPIVVSYNERSSPHAWIVKVADSLDAAAQTQRAASKSKLGAGLTRNDQKLVKDLEDAAKSYDEQGNLQAASLLRELRRFFEEACRRIRDDDLERIVL